MSFNTESKIKIAGMVILYNPDNKVVTNIKSYINYIDFLIIVDNSIVPNDLFVNRFLNKEKICYIASGKNIGVASALNLGCSIAIEKNFTHLLTMDQDSSFDDTSINNLIYLTKNLDWKNIGIISPIHITSSEYQEKVLKIEEVSYTMTSGNVLNLKVYLKVGIFLDWLFIDHIDHEYGLRLNKYGFKVLQINSIKMFHQLGELKIIKIFGKKIFSFVSHSPLRTFYMIRNGLYVAKTYSVFAKKNRVLMIKEIIKILGENDRIKRIKFILQAVKFNGKIEK